MINLELLDDRLEELSIYDWNELWELIPKIENASSFGTWGGGNKLADGSVQFPYMISSEEVNEFFNTVHRLNIVPIFDWVNWKRGRELLDNRNNDFSEVSRVDLCKLITIIIRADRFNEGYLVSCFEDGTVLKILKALKEKIDEMHQD